LIDDIARLTMRPRIGRLRDAMVEEPRYMSLEQALIVTEVYKRNESDPVPVKRAKALAAALRRLEIAIHPEELLVGNRTAGVRGGVVFPEAGISWIDREIETLPTRPQDAFSVKPGDVGLFRREILPYWKGKSLEDVIRREAGGTVDAIARVVKVNQKDHAQGHICPDAAKWIRLGPAGLAREARAAKAATRDPAKAQFYDCAVMVLEAASDFMRRYADLALSMAAERPDCRESLQKAAANCRALAERGAETFHEALQAMWFLFVILHMESNASSFSPGRADQYLYPHFARDIASGRLTVDDALELCEAAWVKFNQIVYMRNAHSASFFAGFPIGFNIAVGGQTRDGLDATNELSYLFLKCQEHLALPQPNLSARLHAGSPERFVLECARVIGKGGGMPQVFNDESIIPALKRQGVEDGDARDYAVVGCVELTTQGNNLGWSDAAMFNLVKALELALNDGVCLLDGERIGPATGSLGAFERYEDVEAAFTAQIDYFFDRMIEACVKVEEIHQRLLPSAFLSTVVDDCLRDGVDVTAGGAKYNLSGIQVIQAANIADCLAALRKLVFEKKTIDRRELLEALRRDFAGSEGLRQRLLNKAPKYGNDVEWVDLIANKWVTYFSDKLERLVNYRGGRYHSGLYTVSAHVPMGANVGATPDGRKTREPLADGGMSAVYGRDLKGPTALLRSVSRVDSARGSNGTLLNMKFLPRVFATEEGIRKFAALLRSFVKLRINHVQFNVVDREELLAAQEHPDRYRGLTIRVAGYTAYFTELAHDLQNEIIARTSHGEL
jgi:formate C-acetyltransferase